MSFTRFLVRLASPLLLVAISANVSAKSPAEEVQDIRSEFLSEAVKARAAYRRELQKAAKSAVSDYEKAATSAVRAGDLAAATEAMRQILLLDRDHKKAKAHFEAIGQLDEVLKELEDEPVMPEGDEVVNTGKLGRELVGTTWSWGDGKSLTFANGGRCTFAGDAKPNTRIWRVAADGSVHVATTSPEKVYTILRFDSSVKNVAGKSYHLDNPNIRGQRIR